MLQLWGPQSCWTGAFLSRTVLGGACLFLWIRFVLRGRCDHTKVEHSVLAEIGDLLRILNSAEPPEGEGDASRRLEYLLR